MCVECKAVEARAAQCAVPFIIRVPALLMAVMPVGSLCRESDGAATAARASLHTRCRSRSASAVVLGYWMLLTSLFLAFSLARPRWPLRSARSNGCSHGARCTVDHLGWPTDPPGCSVPGACRSGAESTIL